MRPSRKPKIARDYGLHLPQRSVRNLRLCYMAMAACSELLLLHEVEIELECQEFSVLTFTDRLAPNIMLRKCKIP